MKRCPHCEFLYEDDQSLCDMDGMELVHAPGLLTNKGSATKPPATQRAKSRLISVAAILVGAFLLLAVLSFLYSALGFRARQNASQPSVEEPANLESISDSTEVLGELTAVQPAENTSDTEVNSSAGPTSHPSPKRQEKSASQVKSNPKKDTKNQNKDSKVESVLKKAGRILKKPFE